MAWVKFVREDIEIEVEDGISVLEAEIQAGLWPDAPCGGLGKCGKCLVKINGEVVKACQIRIGEGETCVVETLDRAGNEKILTDGKQGRSGRTGRGCWIRWRRQMVRLSRGRWRWI